MPKKKSEELTEDEKKELEEMDEQTVELSEKEKEELDRFNEETEKDSDPDLEDGRSSNNLLVSGIGATQAPKEPKPEGYEEKDTRTIIMETTIKELFSKEQLHMKTDLTNKQIRNFGRGQLFAEMFESVVMGRFIQIIEELSVSKQRKGRQEMSSIINQSSSGMMEEEGGSAHLLDKLLTK